MGLPPCLAKLAMMAPRDKHHRLASEFSKLGKVDEAARRKLDATFKTALSHVHSSKNRYTDVLANEATLYPPTPSTHGYINGNLIPRTLFQTPRDIVACQAPLPGHIGEFWDVVVDSKCPLIINLTGLVENGRVKSHRYWPAKEGQTKAFGPDGTSRVTLVEEVPAALSPVSDTSLRRLKHEDSGHEIVVAHFEGWPDMGVPSSTEAVRNLVDLMEQTRTTPDAPIFIHCSAGIGRTGTLIASYAARHMLRDGRLNTDGAICEIVANLKQHRHGMVQRLEQYTFVYLCAMADAKHMHAAASVPSPSASRCKASDSASSSDETGDDNDDAA